MSLRSHRSSRQKKKHISVKPSTSPKGRKILEMEWVRAQSPMEWDMQRFRFLQICRVLTSSYGVEHWASPRLSPSESEHRCVLLLRVVGRMETGECDSQKTEKVSLKVSLVCWRYWSVPPHVLSYSLLFKRVLKNQRILFLVKEREESVNSGPLPGSSIDVPG